MLLTPRRARLPQTRLDANMITFQHIVLSIAFGVVISISIEYLNRIQIRAFYSALSVKTRVTDRPGSSITRDAYIDGSLVRCVLMAILLSGLTYGCIVRNVMCVVVMGIVITYYLASVSWSEIRQLRPPTS